MKLIYSLLSLSTALLEQEMEFLAVYTVGRWGLQTILPPSNSVIFGMGRGHFIYALHSENRHQTYIHT